MFIVIPTLIIVAFLTLLERKILRLIQYRKGPAKPSTWGILQPLADALKLFLKAHSFPLFRNSLLFIAAPRLRLGLILVLWNFLPLRETPLSFIYTLFLILTLIRFSVYPLLIAGWASNNKYAAWGAIRGVAQTISYEVRLTLMVFSLLALVRAFNLTNILQLNDFIPLILLFFPLLTLWLFSCILETNRTPFDFAEGESELVSGFNTEYRSGTFAIIFLAEYAGILFFSLLFRRLAQFNSCSYLKAYLRLTLIAGFWIWLRASYPRYRYDLLIEIAWKSFLPLTLTLTFYILTISVMAKYKTRLIKLVAFKAKDRLYN